MDEASCYQSSHTSRGELIMLKNLPNMLCFEFITQIIVLIFIQRFPKKILAHVGMPQCNNTLADKVQKQKVPCTQ